MNTMQTYKQKIETTLEYALEKLIELKTEIET